MKMNLKKTTLNIYIISEEKLRLPIHILAVWRKTVSNPLSMAWS